MKVGDLVKWEDSKGKIDLGIVLELDEPPSTQDT